VVHNTVLNSPGIFTHIVHTINTAPMISNGVDKTMECDRKYRSWQEYNAEWLSLTLVTITIKQHQYSGKTNDHTPEKHIN